MSKVDSWSCIIANDDKIEYNPQYRTPALSQLDKDIKSTLGKAMWRCRRGKGEIELFNLSYDEAKKRLTSVAMAHDRSLSIRIRDNFHARFLII